MSEREYMPEAYGSIIPDWVVDRLIKDVREREEHSDWLRLAAEPDPPIAEWESEGGPA